jgi:hypothetical protein
LCRANYPNKIFILAKKGGDDIMLDRDYHHGGITHKKGAMFPIEDVLKMANGIHGVECNK